MLKPEQILQLKINARRHLRKQIIELTCGIEKVLETADYIQYDDKKQATLLVEDIYEECQDILLNTLRLEMTHLNDEFTR